MTQRFPKLFLLLLGALFLLNLLQSHFTQLIYDESYYWYYSQNMAWGYFDHPPMVALMVKISSFLFEGGLGVRFISCLLGLGTYLLIWAMVGKPKKSKDIWLLFALLFSMPLLNAYGFFTLPDTPLLFFTALFLCCYKNFLTKPTLLTAIALGLTMAGLMYSKYHAVLVIIFVIISNWRLVRQKFAWVAVLISLLCYLPHIMWLYQQDFVTIKYHLFERPNHAYDFVEFTLGYLLNLVVIFGLLFVWYYWALFKNLKNKDLFIRALTFLSLGIILFFFVSSFDRRVQTQWVVVICVPIAILTYNFITEQKINTKWIFRLGLVSCAILLFARVGLIYEPLFPVIYETHGNKQWTNKLKEKSNGMPIVFENSYRRASMYQFYSGMPAFSLNNIHFRLNQYSIDSSEAKMQHKDIVYVTQYAKDGDISYSHPDGTVDHGFFRKDFESFRKLECILEDEPIDLEKQEITVKIYNPYEEDIDLDKIRLFMAHLNEYKQLLKTSQLTRLGSNDANKALRSKDTVELLYQLPKKRIDSTAFVKFGVSENGLQPGINSSSIKIKI